MAKNKSALQAELNAMLPIGKLAERTGLSVSAIRFYEKEGLIRAMRNTGGQRRFLRSDIRRISFIMIAQGLGFSLSEIRHELKGLPDERTPTAKDWAAVSRRFKSALDVKIEAMTRMRDNLSGCIGCGCLSLKNCRLYNPDDRAGAAGAGARYLMGDKPSRR